jgi:hypothetical protein
VFFSYPWYTVWYTTAFSQVSISGLEPPSFSLQIVFLYVSKYECTWEIKGYLTYCDMLRLLAGTKTRGRHIHTLHNIHIQPKRLEWGMKQVWWRVPVVLGVWGQRQKRQADTLGYCVLLPSVQTWGDVRERTDTAARVTEHTHTHTSTGFISTLLNTIPMKGRCDPLHWKSHH